MNLIFKNRDQLQGNGPLVDEFDSLIERIRANWRIEHKDDGSHGAVNADSLTLRDNTRDTYIIGADQPAPMGRVRLYDEQGREILIEATDRTTTDSSSPESVVRITSQARLSPSAAPTVVEIGALVPHTVGYASGPGVFLREDLLGTNDAASLKKGWAISASFADSLLTGRSMLAVTDTVENKSIFAIRPVGAAGAVTSYCFGPFSAGVVVLGTLVTLGRSASGERWQEIHGVTQYALTAYILGAADTTGIRLTNPVAGYMAVRLGDDSGYGNVYAGVMIAFSYLHSASTNGNIYIGPSGTSDNILLRKDGSGILAVRLGDDSAYAALKVQSLTASASMLAPYYVIGSADTNGVRLRVNSGNFEVREGDDSGYTHVIGAIFASQSGYVQSASTVYYFGQGVSTDALMRKTSSGTLAVRLGDDSAYGNLEVAILNATSAVLAGSVYYLGPQSTSGALLRLSSGTPVLREGDDSDYNDLIVRSLIASASVFATTGVYFPSSGANDVYLKKNGTNILAVRKGDDSGYATLEAAAVSASVSVSAAGALMTDKTGSTGYSLQLASGAFGTGAVGGSYVQIGANSSGSGAAGTLVLQRRGGTLDAVWSDNAGLLRTNTGSPNESGAFGFSDTSGTVVGDQTSSRAAKHILRERHDYQAALNTILRTPVYDFIYKDGRYHGETFTGITTDDSPTFGKDRGKSFNPVTSFGYVVNAMKAQQQQIEDLQAELDTTPRWVRWICRLVRRAR